MSGLNPTAIEWCKFTWNPIVGCTHGCPWCYARRQAKRQKHNCDLCYRFEPHLHAERLLAVTPRQKPARIFVCSMAEFFDPDVPQHWQAAVFLAMDKAPQHTFIILTKRSDLAVARLRTVKVRPNWWFMTSITNQADADLRVPEILKLKALGWPVVGVSYEPALDTVDFDKYPELDWIIIGAQTGPGKRDPNIPLALCANTIISAHRTNVPVFVKNNVGWAKQIREFPRNRCPS